MKINQMKEFKRRLGLTLDDVIKYLADELGISLREIQNGFNRLTFQENFQSFSVDLVIAATSEIQIRNDLRNVIPSGYVIFKTTGTGVVLGDTAWTQDYLYLKNTAASSVTLTVIFFK